LKAGQSEAYARAAWVPFGACAIGAIAHVGCCSGAWGARSPLAPFAALVTQRSSINRSSLSCSSARTFRGFRAARSSLKARADVEVGALERGELAANARDATDRGAVLADGDVDDVEDLAPDAVARGAAPRDAAAHVMAELAGGRAGAAALL